MRRPLPSHTLVVLVALVGLAAACSSSTSTTGTGSGTGTGDRTTTDGTAPTGTDAPGAGAAITNTWVADGTVDPTALPIGDGRSSTAGAAVGTVYACQGGGGVGGANVDGPWIHGDTFDRTAKVHVQGDVSWPSADFTVTIDGGARTIRTNDLPVETHTGTFPIASGDPAYAYDQNPNHISEKSSTLTLPVAPTAAGAVGCLPGGAIGILANGVFLFDALDGEGRDAVAHETQDLCDGHPAPGDEYHYHDVPSCLVDAATGPSTVVGWADDGYPIVVERDAGGSLPTDADLDECHGRTSPVLVDGQLVTTYHYSATLEFPYVLGCFHGTNAVQQQARGGPPT